MTSAQSTRDRSPKDYRRLAILGSTGSIGRQTLEVVSRFPDRFKVESLAAGTNVDLLIEQARLFRPKRVVIADPALETRLHKALAGSRVEVASGPEAIDDLATSRAADLVVAAMVGYSGLRPVLAAAAAGNDIALANKEALVVAGELVTRTMERSRSRLIPIDSEHSAIFQCLEGEDLGAVEELILTASGGPFRDRPAETFASVTLEEALAHPNWSMGRKVTIDSATMMNKGLELIEAHWLFGLDADQIRMVIHPQSIIHSMVVFVDGSVKAQLSRPDMQLPIQYALSYPERLPCDRGRIDWTELVELEFRAPDPVRFPCVGMAYRALERGGSAPAVLNAANEEAVALFLDDRIAFTEIPELIEETIENIQIVDQPNLEALVEADAAARCHIKELKHLTAN